MKKTLSFLACSAIAFSLGASVANAGTCSSANLTKAIREATNREPIGSGTSGECDPGRYNIVVTRGSSPSFQQLLEKVRSSLLAPKQTSSTPPVKARTRGVTSERCFGAVGSKCEGAPRAGRSGNTLWVSVGSILHDNCCLANPGGKWCSGLASEWNHNGQCVNEWDKATWNTLYDGRQWQVNFDPNAVPDLTWVTARTSRFQNGSYYRGWETRATAQLKAPSGTALDPGDQAFCASGSAREYNVWGTPKRWIVCN